MTYTSIAVTPGNSLSKTLNKYWTAVAKGLSKATNALSVEHVGHDFLFDFFHTVPDGDFEADTIDKNHDYAFFSLGYLASLAENDRELAQFEIEPAKVEKLLLNSEFGLLKGNKLFNPIEVSTLKGTGKLFITSGRHRLAAFLTLTDGVKGNSNLLLPVRIRHAQTYGELVQLVTLANTSRNMVNAEKLHLRQASRGVITNAATPFSDVVQRKYATAAEVKELFALGLLCSLRESGFFDEHEVTENTVTDLGVKVFYQVSVRLNKLVTNSGKVLLAHDEEGYPVWASLCQRVSKMVTEHWLQYVSTITLPVRDRSGNVKTDVDGKTVVSCNVSRDIGVIASEIASQCISLWGEKLSSTYQKQVSEAAAEKVAKAQDKAEKEKQKQLADIDSLLAMLGDMITPEQRATLSARKAEIISEPAKDDSIDDLLG